LNLRPGFDVVFTAENIIAIDHPPEDYILEKYGATSSMNSCPTGRCRRTGASVAALPLALAAERR
jgi:hypothetical protein